MKKRFTFAMLIVALVCFACLGFAACDDQPTTTDAKYTGLYTFVRDSGDAGVFVAYLELAEDGTFWYENETVAEKYCIGTYAYNSDKTEITLTGSYGLDYLDGTYSVEVRDGKVTILDVYVLVYEGNKLTDNFTYDEVRTAPARKPITIVKFMQEGDADSYIEIKTENKYELYVADHEIMSSGTYTEVKDGDTKTLTLTDDLGEMENATFTFTYTYTDGKYSDLVLKGTGIDEDEGVKFVFERPTTMVLTANVTTDMGMTETVTVKFYADIPNQFDVTFTAFGNPATVSGTFVQDVAARTINFDMTGDPNAAMVTSLTGTLDEVTFMPTVNVSFAISMGEYGTYEYSATLTFTLA